MTFLIGEIFPGVRVPVNRLELVPPVRTGVLTGVRTVVFFSRLVTDGVLEVEFLTDELRPEVREKLPDCPRLVTLREIDDDRDCDDLEGNERLCENPRLRLESDEREDEDRLEENDDPREEDLNP